MKRTATTLRCVPRYGYADTQVRTVDLDLFPNAEEDDIRAELARYFASRGIQDAIYDLDVDDYGYFAIVNDEAYLRDWGADLL